MSVQHRVPVILTRAQAQSERFAADLPEGTYAVISPLLRIAFLPLSDAPSANETLLFTSENGVAALVATGGGHQGQTAFCVGDRTANVANTAGFAAKSAHGTASDLIELARTTHAPLVHIRGEHTRGDISKKLRESGRACRELVLYRQLPTELSPTASKVLSSDEPCILPLFSPRTAELFQSACPVSSKAHLVCISRSVAEVLNASAYGSISVSEFPTASSLLEKLSGRLQAIRLET